MAVAHGEYDVSREGVGLWLKGNDDPEETSSEGVDHLLQGIVGHRSLDFDLLESEGDRGGLGLSQTRWVGPVRFGDEPLPRRFCVPSARDASRDELTHGHSIPPWSFWV